MRSRRKMSLPLNRDVKKETKRLIKTRPIAQSKCFVPVCNHRRSQITLGGWQPCQMCVFDAVQPAFCCGQHVDIIKALIKLFTPHILVHRYNDRKLLCPRHLRFELRQYSANHHAANLSMAQIRGMYNDAAARGAEMAFATVFVGLQIGDGNASMSSNDDD
jgi:hypothetical protein